MRDPLLCGVSSPWGCQQPQPAILYAVPPREGHMRPALQICAYLIERGFDVTILGSSKWQSSIQAIGGHFSPIIGLWNTLDDYKRWPKIAFAPDSARQLAASLAEGFTTLLPSGYQSVWFALAGMRSRLGKREIVVLSDTCFSGTVPLKLGVDLPPGFEVEEDIKVLGISVVPSHWVSPERPPWGSGLPYDSSEAGKARNRAAHTAVWDQEAEIRARDVLNLMNCPKLLDTVLDKYSKDHDEVRHPFWDAVSLINDETLQMGLSSLEYPSPNWPAHFKFAGPLPLKSLPADLKYPAWWKEVEQHSAIQHIQAEAKRKRIITVTQGTEVMDYQQLIIPTLCALSDRNDLLVIALLGKRGATLDAYLEHLPEKTLPANTRVLDYFPYDALLVHSDVFVSNSGYGGLTHAVTNGVPMVQTGKDFDKPDIGRRIEYAGLGIFLANPPPEPKDVQDAINRILEDDAYKIQAKALQAKAKETRPLETVEAEIMRLVGLKKSAPG